MSRPVAYLTLLGALSVGWASPLSWHEQLAGCRIPPEEVVEVFVPRSNQLAR